MNKSTKLVTKFRRIINPAEWGINNIGKFTVSDANGNTKTPRGWAI